MQNVRGRIRYHGDYADCTSMAEDNVSSIENSILDKRGKNQVWFEADGFTNKKGKWLTYEGVINDTRTVRTKEVLGVKLGERV